MEGTHDFTQFSSVGTSEFDVPGVKTLTAADVIRVPEGLKMVFSGSGFLYNQCRHMAGCLIRVGMGALPVDAVQELLYIGKPGGECRPLTGAR